MRNSMKAFASPTLSLNTPDGAARLWSLALLLLALAAQAPALPLAGWLPLGLALASRLLPASPWSNALRLLSLALCVGAAGLAFGWLESTTLRLSLLLVLALKWAESRRVQEYALVSAAALVAVAIGMLQWGDGAGVLFVCTGVALLLASFGTLTCAGAPTRPAGKALGVALRDAFRQLLPALPLAALLFLFFPRIPGPLWDIGLSFGLPLPAGIEQSQQGLGASSRLKPGQTQTGASDGEPVLVAEFRNWVPPTNMLYWRGPVFYDFDGSEWQLDAEYASGSGRRLMQKGWRSAADFRQELRSSAQEIRYKVRLSAHNGLWLYALELPAQLTSESFIGPDWQLLSHLPVREEMSYELSSWLEWSAGSSLTAELRQRALALPATGNPQLRALGSELAQQGDADAIMRAGLAQLARGGYRLRDRFTPPEGENALDTFWFETREGNAEFFAASFVILMRAAGVPARLVTGYRGGKLMALTDYVVVKRNHAHAWVEIWDDAKGWRRVDPADLIAPDKYAGTPAQPRQEKKEAPKAQEKPTQSSGGASAPAGGSFAAVVAERPKPGEGWTLPDVSDWLGRWVFRLDAERQQKLLGGQGGGFAWIWLLVLAAAGSALLFAGKLLFGRWRESRRLPPAQRAWHKACRLLARKGLTGRTGECPSEFARRVSEERPQWAEAMRQLGDSYAEWRYGRSPAAAAPAVSQASRLLINRILSE